MHRFLVVIEKTDNNYSAYSPDLPGCIATGDTQEEVKGNIYDAIQLHINGMKEDNQPIPPPTASAEYIAL